LISALFTFNFAFWLYDIVSKKEADTTKTLWVLLSHTIILLLFSLTAQLPNQVVCGQQDVSGDEQTNLGAAQTKKLASYIFFSHKKKKEEAESTFVLSARRIHC